MMATDLLNFATTLRPQYEAKINKKRRLPRHRLTHEQKQFLETRFQKNPHWSTEYVKDLANRLNISF